MTKMVSTSSTPGKPKQSYSTPIRINSNRFLLACVPVLALFVYAALLSSKVRNITSTSEGGRCGLASVTTPHYISQPEYYSDDTSPISKIYLLGERNSGTKFVEELMRKALHSRYGRYGSIYPFSTRIPILGFKHMFRHTLLNLSEIKSLQEMEDALWILVIRNPCDWADGMFRHPWHMCPPNNQTACPGPYIGDNAEATKNTTREEFFTEEWSDWSESIDPKFKRNYTYSDIFELRRHKLSIMQQLVDSIPAKRVKIAQLHEIELSPIKFIKELEVQFQVKVNATHMEDQNLLSSGIVHPPLCLSDQEYDIVQNRIDWDMEGHFGYHRLSCHTCW